MTEDMLKDETFGPKHFLYMALDTIMNFMIYRYISSSQVLEPVTFMDMELSELVLPIHV